MPKKLYTLDLERLLELALERGILVPNDEPQTPANDAEEQHPIDGYQKLLDLLPSDKGKGGVSQREVLRYIQGLNGTTVPDIAQHFSVSSNKVVGVINGGLQHNILKAGFSDIRPVLRIDKKDGVWCYYPGKWLELQPPVPL